MVSKNFFTTFDYSDEMNTVEQSNCFCENIAS